MGKHSVGSTESAEHSPSSREARPHRPLSVADFPCGKDERHSGGARKGQND